MEAVGDIVMRIPGSGVDTITLRDVYHVPEPHMNLSSIRSAVRRGVKVLFSRDNAEKYCTMTKDGKLLARSDASAGMFGMVGRTARMALAATETPELWHRRYGHLGFEGLAKLAEGALVSGMTTSIHTLITI